MIEGDADCDWRYELWPDSYGVINGASVVGASCDISDFGDETAPPTASQVSMQIRDSTAKPTLFSINHWGAGAGPSLGIGNGPK